MNRQELIVAFAALGFTLEIGVSQRTGGPNAKLLRSVSKSKHPKAEFFYGYVSEEQMINNVSGHYAKYKRIADEREARKAAKRNARENMINPYKEGMILYDSWGYEQTNIDFYQVVEVKKKSVVIRRIAGEMCEGGKESGMSSNVRPLKDQFIGEPIQKNLQVMLRSDGSAEYFVNSKHGWISEYTYGEKGVYSSWYH